VRALLIACLLLLAMGSAYGQPPAGVDPDSPTAKWFRGLTDNNGNGCCGEGDCRTVEFRIRGNNYEALIADPWPDGQDKSWQVVPEDKIVKKTDNPMGRAVACIGPWDWKNNNLAGQPGHPYWYCFVLPYMS